MEDKKIKKEFKSFISELSTDICKEVLLEDLKIISLSFQELLDLFQSQNKVLKCENRDFKRTVDNLEKSIKSVDRFSDALMKNNRNIYDSLKFFKSDYKEFVNYIIDENQKLLEEYRTDIAKINDEERQKLLSEISKSMEETNKKYNTRFEEIFEKNNITKLLNINNKVIDRIDEVEKNTNLILKDNRKELEDNTYLSIQEIEKQNVIINKLLETQSQLEDKINLINNKQRNNNLANYIIISLLIILILVV